MQEWTEWEYPGLFPWQRHEPQTEKKKEENREREKNQLLCNTLQPQIAHSETVASPHIQSTHMWSRAAILAHRSGQTHTEPWLLCVHAVS